jgi:hypothetical protein
MDMLQPSYGEFAAATVKDKEKGALPKKDALRVVAGVQLVAEGVVETVVVADV